MKKALCIGIDSYENIPDLHGCVNDAMRVKEVLERNGDGSLNFSTQIMCAQDADSRITRAMLKDEISHLFEGEPEIALFYYSGHGSYDSLGGYLCTSEVRRADDGVSLNDLMVTAGKSAAKNVIIILDSCHSGFASDSQYMSDYSNLKSGTIILAACDKKQYAMENNGSGIFTSLLIEALYGGAMNLLGDVSPGSIYAYIDRSLGDWEQRPLFKANIKSFVSLRKNVPPISISDLRQITVIFSDPYKELQLDPSFEPDKHEVDDKTVNKKNEAIFALLQKYVKLGLVVPVGEDHMYYAAIRGKACALTAQGRHYWTLVSKNTI